MTQSRQLLALLMPLALVLTGCAATGTADSVSLATASRQPQRAVEIVRDRWGIAHVRGRTDADAVFGMIYAQAEDDFPRIERNYLVALGRLAEAEGEAAIWQDLRQRLFISEEALRREYAASPPWLRALMDAWADGLNHYLATHRQVRPRVLTRFEPWMVLSFTEGSIGADIESISLSALRAFYESGRSAAVDRSVGPDAPRGSNGFAIAPKRSASGNALLLINPHTSFYFRSELQMSSDEGLNAYGAVTWGQFFVYQGFNERLGWMHTTSTIDNVDEFAVRTSRQGEAITYAYGAEQRRVETLPVTVAYRTADGSLAQRSFTTYRTHHGPVVRQEGGRWIATALMRRPIPALTQSFLRTKARSMAEFMRTAALQANSSNNTVYADAAGNIALLYPQFLPRRDDRFDYTKPVDGNDPQTDWRGLHSLEELPSVINPATGWVQNTNNWPFSAAGPNSPRREGFPRYTDRVGENYRGFAALRQLAGDRPFTLETLRDAAYDPYMPGFARLVPLLVQAYDALPQSDPLKARLREQVALLRGWDFRWGVESEATSLAVHWGNFLNDAARARPIESGFPFYRALEERTTPRQKLEALASASTQLEQLHGRWRIAWGEINRFQRLTGDIRQPHRDDAPSIPVGFAPGGWGSLASFAGPRTEGLRRFYGSNGNSFVATVEFGPRIRAKAVSAGGESGDPASPHFNDQAELYARGELRDVYFYPQDVARNAERRYRVQSAPAPRGR
jgi:acyl-homoserine-lactone acylase